MTRAKVWPSAKAVISPSTSATLPCTAAGSARSLSRQRLSTGWRDLQPGDRHACSGDSQQHAASAAGQFQHRSARLASQPYVERQIINLLRRPIGDLGEQRDCPGVRVVGAHRSASAERLCCAMWVRLPLMHSVLSQEPTVRSRTLAHYCMKRHGSWEMTEEQGLP